MDVEQATRNGMKERMLRMQEPVPPTAPIADVPTSPGIWAALSGIGVSPALAAMLRSLAYIIITAALDMGILYFTSTPPAALAIYSTIIIGALRLIEGVVDQSLKPNSNMNPGAKR